MMILAGMGLWLLLGVGAGLLSLRGAPALAPGDRRLVVLWGVFGAVVGGFVGLIPTLPEGYAPWEVGSLVGAALVGVLLSSIVRFQAVRRRRTDPSRRRWFAVSLLGGVTLVAGFAIWFLLEVASPRLYNPGVHPDLDVVLEEEALRDPARHRDQLSDLVELYLSRERNAGIVIGTLVEGARTVVSGGVASKQEGGPPVDELSVFEIGSVSKVFAGLALAQVVVAGEARLDQEIGMLLPAGAPSTGSEGGASITLARLATHSAGLPEYPAATPWWTGLITDNPYAELTGEELLSSLGAALAERPEEPSYAYSSFGFTVLSYLLESATHAAYPQLLRERLFQPLGMTRTRVPMPDAPVAELVDAHGLGRPVPPWTEHGWAGAAGVVSSVDDLLTFAGAHFAPPPGPLGEALELASSDHGPAWGERRMGLGWHIIQEEGRPRILYHVGSTLGSYAYLGVSPEAGIAVVVLANSSDPTAATIGSRVMEALVPPT